MLPDSALRTHGPELIEWIAGYLRDIEQFPVRARTAPGDIARTQADQVPQDGEPIERILSDVREKLIPGITHWQHPGFLAYFANTATAPGILGELMTAGLNVNGMLWATSPAATELEQVVMRWLTQLLGVNDGMFGQITDTASTSSLLALAAAREADPSLDIRGRGLAGRADLPALRVYCSELAHSSIDKAVITLGLGHTNLVRIPVDGDFRMRPDALAERIAADRAAGYRPIAVVATVGTTSVASIDPVPAIADVCAKQNLWLHVDAAYAGSAAMLPELRWILDGVSRADSLVVNPHKWMLTPVGCSALWVRNVAALRRAFTLVPEYLRTNSGDVVDYHDVGFQLGRPFRALKLWMVLRAYGANGLGEVIRAHCAYARALEGWVRATPNWTVIAPVQLSLVCVRYSPPGMSDEDADAENMRIMDTVNRGGRALVSHTKINGRVILRVAIGNGRTEERHVRTAWDEMSRACDTPMGGAR